MIRQEFCEKYNLTENQFYGKEEINGNLNLRDVINIPEGFSPNIIGYLDLENVKTLPKNFSITCGGYLDLSSVKTLPENFSITCDGDLVIKPELKEKIEIKKPVYPLTWQDGKYIIVDGIFQEVVSKKGLIYKVKNIGQNEITYLVTDGNGKWSHGDTYKEAKSSLQYKIGDRDKSRYENLSLDTEFTFGEMVECYRVITGACEGGVRDFIDNKLEGKTKKKYSIEEVIKLTEDSYGYEDFKLFFKKAVI